MRLAWVGLAVVAGLGAAAACAGEDEDPSTFGPDSDAGDDTGPGDPTIIGEGGGASDVAVVVPPGDYCGDAGGLQAGAAWPLQGGCPTRAGRATSAGPQGARVRVLAEIAGGESAPAIGADGTLWIGSSDGTIYAIGSGGGTILRRRKTSAPVRATPAITNAGLAIVAGMDGVLYALDLGDPPVAEDAGTEEEDAAPPETETNVVHRATLSGPAAASPVIAPDGTIYVATTDGKLAAYDPALALRWSIATGDTFGSSPALGQDGTIYVGSTDRALHAVRPDGTSKWTLDLGAEIESSPAVGGDGTIYVGTTSGTLAAVTPEGALRWSFTAGGAIVGTPAVYAGTVYTGCEDMKVYAVSTIDGAAKWQYATQGVVRTPLIAGGGELYFGSSDGRVYALTSKGGLFFAVIAKGPVTSAPAISANGAVYVATENGISVVGP
ncbi:MAG: PQQ-like beta-propeller repeat protein [Labilithrix sp.]|nr:PQQ-like beta-propeller repeat protein [Labilithrix sp.]MCW5809598.1 PQQ-like beta-propeller repeat protein [Labilithrix sp.]